METFPPHDQELLEEIRNVDPTRFEEIVGDLWRAKGWSVNVTQSSRDMSVDAVATKGDTTLAIQAKRYAAGNKIGRPDMEQYSGVRHDSSSIDRIVIVTTSEFTTEAENYALKHDIKYIDGQELIKQIRNVGLFEESPADSSSTKVTRPPEKVPEKHKTQLWGRITGLSILTVAYLFSWGGIALYSGSSTSNMFAFPILISFFGYPILIAMDVAHLRSYDGNYQPSLAWAIASFFTLGAVGLWYYIRRVLRTDIRAAYNLNFR